MVLTHFKTIYFLLCMLSVYPFTLVLLVFFSIMSADCYSDLHVSSYPLFILYSDYTSLCKLHISLPLNTVLTSMYCLYCAVHNTAVILYFTVHVFSNVSFHLSLAVILYCR